MNIPLSFDQSSIKITKLYKIAVADNTFRHEKELLKLLSIFATTSVIGVSLLSLWTQLSLASCIASAIILPLLSIMIDGDKPSINTLILLISSWLLYLTATGVLTSPFAVTMIALNILIPVTTAALFAMKKVASSAEKHFATFELKELVEDGKGAIDTNRPLETQNIIESCIQKLQGIYAYILRIKENSSISQERVQPLLDVSDQQSIEIATLHSDILSIDQKNQNTALCIKLVTILSSLAIMSTIFITLSASSMVVLNCVLPILIHYYKPIPSGELNVML